MSNEQLNALLKNLQTELSTQDSLDGSSKDLLEKLAVDIKKHINPAEDDDEGLGANVETAIHNFEESHPGISKTLSSIFDALNSMGI